MKKVLLLILLFTSFVNCRSQNIVYDANAELRKVENFNGIEVSGTVSLFITQSTQAGVAVSAEDEKYNSKIKTEVKEGILHISVDGGMWNGFSWSDKKLKAYVSIVDLNRLQISGSSNVVITGALKAQDLKVDLAGASEMKGTIQVNNFNLAISGASVVRLTGTAENATIDANGAVKVNAFDLLVENGNLNVAGASHITLSVNKQLKADASGGSTIQYKGNAVAKSLNTNSGATIQKKSDL